MVVESIDSKEAADDVLESLLDAEATGGMRRKMAEGLRKKQLSITDLVGTADGVSFEGARMDSNLQPEVGVCVCLGLRS